MRDRKAAVRFARAFFEDAHQRNAIEQAGRDLATLGAIARQVPELVAFLAHPLVAAEEKKQLLREQLGGLVQPEPMAYIDLLIDRKRAALLPGIVEHFQALVDDHARVVRADVWSATPLSPVDEGRLQAAIARAFGGEPVLSVWVRPELIGGVRVRVKDTVLDGSIRAALKALSADLKAAPCVVPQAEDRGD
jgi:F-type H+-transporting ATPase subunit delta